MAKFFAVIITLGLLVCSCVAHICDVCTCDPSRYQVTNIMCDGESTKHLHLTSSMMYQIPTTSIVTISNQLSLSIERNSFSQLRALDSLVIQNCSHLYIGSGAFSYLNSLFISNVQDLSFGEMALMGARGVKHIVIQSSNMTELPIYSLYDVKDVEELRFEDVSIGKIHKNALNVNAKTITITNAMINYIESNAVTLEGDRVLIGKSKFNTLAPSAINITSPHTKLIENTFYGPLELNITSPFAELLDNSFVHFNSSLTLKHVQMPRMYGNKIYDSDLAQLLHRDYHNDFYDNEFECRCGMNLRNATKYSEDYEVLKKNYCVVNNCTLTLMEFEMESFPRCMHRMQVRANDFCTPERRANTRQPVLTPEQRDSNGTMKISPRFLAFDVEDKQSSAASVFVQKALVMLAVAGVIAFTSS